MKRLVTAFGLLLTYLALAGLPASARPAHAGEVWCWDDPVIQVDGTIVSINLGVRNTDLAAVLGAEVVVSIPAGSVGQVLWIDTTYFTPTVRFVTVESAKGAAPVRQFTATVTLATSRPLDYQIIVQRQDNKNTLTQVSSAYANQPMSLVFSLP